MANFKDMISSELSEKQSSANVLFQSRSIHLDGRPKSLEIVLMNLTTSKPAGDLFREACINSDHQRTVVGQPQAKACFLQTK